MKTEVVKELISENGTDQRIDNFLFKRYKNVPKSHIYQLLRSGQVRVNGKRIDFHYRLALGDLIRIPPIAVPATAAIERRVISKTPPLHVIFEDEALLVINKAVGLVVHPGSGNWNGTLLNALLHHDPALASVPRAGIVHRLDKDTSGLLVVARTLESQTELVRQLQARSVKRHYSALVLGDLEGAGTVAEPIGRHPTQRTRMAVTAGGKPAVTHYSVRRRFRCCTLVECRLETGRTHQIRVHMAHLGHPLVGDETYGRRRVADERLASFPRQALHAFRLGLTHPSSHEDCVWEVPMAPDIDALLGRLEAE